MKKMIVLMVGFLLSIAILVLSLTGTAPRPPLGLAFTGLVLLMLVMDQIVQSVKSKQTDNSRQRTRILFWVMTLVLLMSIGQIAVWRLNFEDEIDEFDEEITDQRRSVTFYEAVDSLPPIKPPVKVEEPKCPYYKPDEVCELNLRELRNIIGDEWNHRYAGFKLSQHMLSMERIGTSRFRFVSVYADVVQPDLPSNQVVVGMSIPTEHPKIALPIGIRLKFDDSKIAQSLKDNVFYLIEGTLVFEDQEPEQIPYHEMKSGQQIMATYIHVDSIEPVKSDTAVIRKTSDKPPWFPTEYTKEGEQE